MAYRLVYGEFWKDPKVFEEMKSEEKLFYIYILTNPYTTNCGIYIISKKQMAVDLGYSIDEINSFMDRFQSHYRLITYNSETRELAIKNWGKHNLNRGGKPVLDCLSAELNKVKDKTLIEYVKERISSESIRALYESFCHRDTTNIRIVPRDVPPQGDNTNTERDTNTNTKINTSTSLNTEIDGKTLTAFKSEEATFVNAGTNTKEEESHNLSLSLIQDYEKLTGHIGVLSLAAVKIAVTQHGYSNVKKAINKALEKGKLNMPYVNGILRTWAIEGYPREDETNGNGSTNKNTGYGKNEFAGFKPPEPTQLTEEERKELEGELL